MKTYIVRLVSISGTLIEAAKSGSVSRFIGRSQSEDSVCNSPNHNRKESASHSNSPNSEAVTESPTDSNPSLDKPDNVDNHHKSHHHHVHQSNTNDHHRNNNDNNSKSNNSNNNKSHHHHLHFSGALAALKRKRKKFSASRNESPVLEPPPEHESPTSSIKNSIKKVIFPKFDPSSHFTKDTFPRQCELKDFSHENSFHLESFTT